MKSCNSKTVETLKHWLANSSTESRCVLHKSQCISSHIYKPRYVHITLWMNNIKILCLHLEIIPRLIPSHFKGHLRDMYLQEHTWIHLHFKNCHKCQSDYSPGQSAPIWLHAFDSFPQVFSQFKPKTELAGCSYPLEASPRGWSTSPGNMSGRNCQGSLSWASQSCALTRVGGVWVEALPPGPFMVSLNSHKNIDHCKSVNDCWMGN